MSYPEPVVNYVSSNLKPHSVVTPKGISEVYVDPEFRRAILLHITKNHLTSLNPALMLAIQGQAGEGKSFQVREICSQVGVYVVPLSGAQLSGMYEGEAVSVFKEAYCFASAVRESTDRMTALVVDDFDLSVAAVMEDRRYTVNTQLLTGFLMNLADDPWRCGDRSTHRVPILFTGNNFGVLHGPLIRHGRMNFFEWSPSFEQKLEIVRHILSGVVREEDLASIPKLVSKFRDKPVSFFASLREDLVDDALQEIASRALSIEELNEAVLAAWRDQALDRIIALGNARERRFARDYLRKDFFWKG